SIAYTFLSNVRRRTFEAAKTLYIGVRSLANLHIGPVVKNSCSCSTASGSSPALLTIPEKKLCQNTSKKELP
ncbi:unnamed protein product, partial [Rotaria magnacalcarata]